MLYKSFLLCSAMIIGTAMTGDVDAKAQNDEARLSDMSATSVTSDDSITLSRLIAIDADCDGSLANETKENAAFSENKTAAPGACVIVQVKFANPTKYVFSELAVKDSADPRTPYRAGSARIAQLPKSLRLTSLKTPAGDTGGELNWSFDGLLQPGASGIVEFAIRLTD